MSSSCTNTRWRLPNTAGVVLCLSLLAMTATAQEVTRRPATDPPREESAPASDKGAEADWLRVLAQDFASRRAALDERRQALERYLDRLSAVDQAATGVDYAMLRQRIAQADVLATDVEDLYTLIDALHRVVDGELPEPASGSSLALEPAPAVSRARIDVHLLGSPDGSRIAIVNSDSLVLRLATDRSSGWALVAASPGLGFIRDLHLRREP